MNEINRRLDLGLPDLEIGDVSFLPMGVMPATSASIDADLEMQINPPPPPPMPGDDGEDSIDTDEDDESEDEKGLHDEWKVYVKTVLDPVERRARASVKRHFFDMRADVLHALEAMTGAGKGSDEAVLRTPAALTPAQLEVLFANQDEWDKQLRKIMGNVYLDAAKAAADQAQGQIGAFQVFSVQDPRLAEKFAAKQLKVTRINRTIRERLRGSIMEAIAKTVTVE